MPSFREFFVGPWRAVAVLGVTQILAWGAIFYTPVLILPLIAEQRGFSLDLCDGWIFRRPARGGIYRADRRLPDRSLRRALRDAVRVACRRGRACGDDLRKPSGRLCCGMDGPRRRDGGIALRSGLRDAWAHLRSACAPADHGADAGRRLCLNGELARHLRAAQAARLAGHVPGLRRAARFRRRAAACLRAAAHSRRGRYRARRRGGARPASPSRKRRRIPAACRGVLGLCLYPLRVSRRICSRSCNAPGSMPQRLSSSGRCSAPLRSPRACASSSSRATSIR